MSRIGAALSRIDAAWLGAIALFAVYALTLAPDVTFWDAGEFIAAAHSVGVPHPPGTPLFVLLTTVWAKLFFFLPYPVATNTFSAAATAICAGVSARMVHRATGSAAMAVAAAIAAGGMSSVWLNATETEVYAASLALGVLMIWAGEHAGRDASGRHWTLLTAYLIALAVPLHLSALVAAPPAIALASLTRVGVLWRRGVLLTGVLVAAMGVGRMSPTLVVAGAAIFVAAFWPFRPLRTVLSVPVAAAVVVIALSALAFLYVRAAHDPAINQGDPSTWQAFVDVVARRQYAVSPMWPRMAPVWIQLGNLGQYADWQVALSAGPTVMPSVLRTLGTFAFLYLAYLGARYHWSVDRRTSIGFGALLLCGTLGVLVYLNLHAGPSIGYGLLPANTVREARERDYFFVYGFWAWGLWAGMGAVALARRWSRPAWAGVLLALVPIVMNWRAVTRRGEPEQSLPRAFGQMLLRATPERGVLFVMGDNDSYPLWFLQVVERERTDVAVITVPLLPTRWYRDEIARRHGLLDSAAVERYDGKLETAARIADGARRDDRAVVAAVTMTASEREKLGGRWLAYGPVYVERAPPSDARPRSPTSDAPRPSQTPDVGRPTSGIEIDTAAANRWARWVAARVPRRVTREAIDPVNSYHRRLLDCAEQLAAFAQNSDTTRLDSACNHR